MQPLVLAIEPDSRQAAIVKRIVREKVLADVAVVDSRDAALEAIRTTMPDVLLLSALMSPRDEDELMAHLRTLHHAAHLQTYTIPQLASAIGPGDAKPKGLLSAFRRRKGVETAPAGCDPELFAEEIRAYLGRAAEKKREMQTAAANASLSPSAAPVVSAPREERAAALDQDSSSSWSSPFEWRPSTATTTMPDLAPPELADFPELPPEAATPEEVAAPLIAAQEVVASQIAQEVAAPQIAAQEVAAPQIAAQEAASPQIAAQDIATPLTDAAFWAPQAVEPAATVAEPPAAAFAAVAAQASAPEPAPSAPRAPRFKLKDPQLVIRRKGARTDEALRWWRAEEGTGVDAEEPDSELREVLATLAVPPMVAGVSYAEGCRIRRVRLSAA